MDTKSSERDFFLACLEYLGWQEGVRPITGKSQRTFSSLIPHRTTGRKGEVGILGLTVSLAAQNWGIQKISPWFPTQNKHGSGYILEVLH